VDILRQFQPDSLTSVVSGGSDVQLLQILHSPQRLGKSYQPLDVAKPYALLWQSPMREKPRSETKSIVELKNSTVNLFTCDHLLKT
jgi:hypothetical protein